MRDVVLLLSFLVLPLSAGAADKRQDAPVSDTAVPYDLGVLVVTAARTEKPATVETITRSELETQGAVTVADALGKVPGVTVTAGPKDEAGVMVRGISSQRVLLMIDGRPINMPYYGSLDINSLQLDNVSRIQVTKGVPSLLYGVNGTGGVVNVVTSRPLDEGTYGIAATASGGEVRSQRVQAAVHTRREKIDLSGTLSRSVSGGYRLSRDFSSPLGIEDGGVRDNSDFERYNATGKAGYHFDDNSSAVVSCGYYTDEKGIPSPTDFAQYRRFKKWRRSFVDMSGRYLLKNNLNIKGKVYYDDFDNEMIEYGDRTLDSMTWDSFHDHWDFGTMASLDVPFHSHTVSFGANGKHESASTGGYMNNPWETFAMTTGSAALEGHFRLAPSMAFTIGVGASGAASKADTASAYENNMGINGIGGINGVFLDHGTFHGGYGVYTRYPTLSQLFSSERGNPDLLPESSINAECGASYAFFTFLETHLTLFDEEFRNLIVRYRVPGTPASRYENVARAYSRGAETGFDLALPKAETRLSFTYVYTATWDYNAGKPLPYVPAQSIGSGFSFRFFKHGLLWFHAQWAGERAGEGRHVWYDPYLVADTRLAWNWKTLCAALVVNNLFDTDYATEDPAYPMPGRMIRGELAMQLRGKLKTAGASE